MAETAKEGQPESSQDRNTFKSTLQVSVTTVIITAAEFFDEHNQGGLGPKIARILAPLVGFIVANVATYYLKNWEDKRSEERLKQYIHELDMDLRDPKVSRDRKKSITDELIFYQERLATVRKSSEKRRMIS